MPLPALAVIAKVAIKGMIKGAVKGAVKVGAKQTIKGAAKKAVKKKLSARNIKSNLLKKRDKLKKLQIERDKQESRETVEKSSSNQQESKKGGGSILGKSTGFLGKIISATLTLMVGWIIAKLRGFATAIGKVIDFIKPVWDIIMGTLSKMVGGIMFIFKAAAGIMGLGKKNRELEEAKTSMKKSNEGINKELEKQEFSGEKDKDEGQEDKKDSRKKDDIISKALKESSDFIQSEATINKVDDKQDQSSQKSLSKESVLGKVNKVVKGKGDKAKSKFQSQNKQVSPVIQKALDKVNKKGLSGLETTKSVNGGLGPTQKQKNRGKVIVQPVEKVVRVNGGSGSSGGSGTGNVKSPVLSLSGSSMRIP